MMVRPLRYLAAPALVLGLAGGVLGGVGSAGASPPFGGPPPKAHALFLETDQSSGNEILAYIRATDGTVSLTGTYSTGGAGASAVTASADKLASQGGLALVNGDRGLVAVNAGSNTISYFTVKGSALTLVQTLTSGGTFPASVTSDGSTVVVLNSGGQGSVAEFSLRGNHLAPIPGEIRSLGLTNTNPPFYLAGVGQVGFTPSGQQLIVTTKHSTNSYEVFNIGPDGVLATTPVKTPSATPVPFAFTFDPSGRLVATEALTSNVSTYTVNQDGSLTHIGSVADGGAALCWITEVNGTYYGSNAGSGTVSSFTVNATGTPTLQNSVAAKAHPGTTDSAASPDGRFLYVESGGSGAFDAFAVGPTGTLTPVETVWNIPVGSEGIAAS